MLERRGWFMVALVGVGATAIVVLNGFLRRATRASADLAALWVGGVETMLNVPGEGTFSLAVAETAAASRASFPSGVPSALASGATFALTAFDPPGVERTRDANAAANAELWERELRALPFDAAWRGFGVDVGEGWREDGFCVRFAEADVGRGAIVAAARAFDQGAVYEYVAKDGALFRRTLGVGVAVDETTPMARVDHAALAASSPRLAGLSWAGPATFPPES